MLLLLLKKILLAEQLLLPLKLCVCACVCGVCVCGVCVCVCEGGGWVHVSVYWVEEGGGWVVEALT